MDLELIALKIQLFGKVTLDMWLFELTLFKMKIWEYSTPPITKEIFNIHKNTPDESPPQFVESTTPVVSILFLVI